MKLAAIYNVWDGVELLRGSMNCIKDHVDVFVIVYQDVSNKGEKYDPLEEVDLSGLNNIRIIKYDPILEANGTYNERRKRNLGLDIAREEKCTHFLHMDCDEYYEDFWKAKRDFRHSGAKGSVCELLTYFKLPTYRFENVDNYFVPFIHQLRNDTFAGQFSIYPFYVDPTRNINEKDVVKLESKMHHFSWVRKNIERKVRNSSANLGNSQLLQNYNSPELKPGYYVNDYHQKLIEVPNLFNIQI